MSSLAGWKPVLGVGDKAVVQAVEIAGDGSRVDAQVRPRKPTKPRCGRCGRRAPGYDHGDGRRCWRALDVGTVRCYVWAEAPRVDCPEHGPTVIQFPWARHDAGYTRAFEEQVAWLAVRTSKSAVKELMRIAWATVGAVIARVAAEQRAASDPLAGLRRIGIDAVAYRKGHRYLTVVVCHDSGRLVWAAKGSSKTTLAKFFAELGEARCAQLRLVSADGAEWIADVVAEHCANARLCLDPFHVCQAASEALDEVRREVQNDARRAGQKGLAADIKGARFALWRNPEDLTEGQQTKLSAIQKSNQRLYRAYLLKEQLRQVFHQPTVPAALELLDAWLAWACRSKIPAFVKLSRTVRDRRADIAASLESGLSNARVESINQKIKVLARVAFGFHTAEALIAMAMLALGGLCPPLPGRGQPTIA